MSTYIGVASVLSYLTGAVLVGLRLMPGHRATSAGRGGLAGAAIIAVCLHAAVLYRAILTDAGVNLGFFNAASLVAWVIVVLLVIAAINRPLDNLGIFVLPLAAITVVLALSFPSQRVISSEGGAGVEIHIIISIVAASLLTIAAFQAIVLAYQETRLRAKRPGAVIRVLPPLQTQEALLFQLIGVGFFFLSLSLVSGAMFLQDVFAQHLAHKTALSISAWCVFAVLLWGRWRHGWRGLTATAWCLGGFTALMFAYFGSKLVLEVFLGRTWS